MEIDITQIVVALIGLLSVIITSVVVPLIKSKVTNSQWEMITKYALAGVQAAEIIIGAGNGEAKFEMVRTILKNNVLHTTSRSTWIPLKSPSKTHGSLWGWIISMKVK